MTSPAHDQGFALLDAVMAAALLSLAGTVALMIGNGALARSDADLDRSAMLLTLESLVTEARLVGADNMAAVLPQTIGAFSYDLVQSGTPAIAAFKSDNPGTPVLSFDLAASSAGS